MQTKTKFTLIGLCAAFVALFFAMPTFAKYGDVSTYSSVIYKGDGGAATNAYLDFPEDMVFDSDGNALVADTYNNVIRKIDTGGGIITLAGSGSYGEADGATTQAEFALPRGIAISGGDIFVADGGSSKIRKISGGNVTTLVSEGLNNPNGLVVIGSTLYIADSGGSAIRKVGTGGGSLETVTTNVTTPEKLEPTADGHLFVTDSGGHRVLRVDVNSGNVTTIAGSGSNKYAEGTGTGASFQNVIGIARDGSTLYVNDGDGLEDRIRTVDINSGSTALVVDNPNMTFINNPRGMDIKNGQLFVVNSGLGAINYYKLGSKDPRPYAGKNRFQNDTGSQSDTALGRPYQMVVSPDGSKMYIAQNNQIKAINLATGESEHIIGSIIDNYIEGNDNTPARFSTVTGITIDSEGKNLYVADHWNNRIRRIDLATKTSSLVSGGGKINCQGDCNGYAEGSKDDARFNSPSDLVVSPDNQYLYVTDTSNNRVREVRISDGQTRLIAGSGNAAAASGSAANFNRPYGIEIDNSGKYLFVADSNNHRIQKINISSGEVTTVAGSGKNGFRDGTGSDAFLSFPEYITKDKNGKLYFTEVGSHRVKYLDPGSGLVITIAGSGERGFKNGSRFDTEFNNLKGLAVSPNQNTLFVADSWNDLIRQIDITGNPPFAEPAPSVSGISPADRFKVASKSTDTKFLEVTGSNFKHGAKAYFGTFEANQTLVNSESKLTVEVPFGKMPVGYYDVKVKNIDGQSGVKVDGFIVLKSDGSLPDRIQKAEPSQSSFSAYREDFRGGYTLTAGQVLRGKNPSVVTGLLEGFGPQVRVFEEDGTVKAQFFAYADHLRSGVRVATCDFNGDGIDEIVTGPGKGGRPHVRIFNAFGTPVISNGFFALDKKFQGGVNVACGDVTGNGKPEIIIAASKGGGPHVTVHKPDGTLIANFFAYGKNFRGGIKLAVADLNGDGRKQILTGPEQGAPHVQLFGVRTGGVKRLTPGFYAFHPDFRGGLSLAGGDTNGSGKDEIIVSQRTGGQAWVKVYNGEDQGIRKTFLGYDGNFDGGTVVAAEDVDGDSKAEVITIPGSKGSPQVRVFSVD